MNIFLAFRWKRIFVCVTLAEHNEPRSWSNQPLPLSITHLFGWSGSSITPGCNDDIMVAPRPNMWLHARWFRKPAGLHRISWFLIHRKRMPKSKWHLVCSGRCNPNKWRGWSGAHRPSFSVACDWKFPDFNQLWSFQQQWWPNTSIWEQHEAKAIVDPQTIDAILFLSSWTREKQYKIQGFLDCAPLFKQITSVFHFFSYIQ